MKIGLHLPCLPHICIICLMEVGIIGLPGSGKSSLFQALTGLKEGAPGTTSRLMSTVVLVVLFRGGGKSVGLLEMYSTSTGVCK